HALPALDSFPTRRSSDLDPRIVLRPETAPEPLDQRVSRPTAFRVGAIHRWLAALAVRVVDHSASATWASRRRVGKLGATSESWLDRKSTRLNSSHRTISY